MSKPDETSDPLAAIFPLSDLNILKLPAYAGRDASPEAMKSILDWRMARITSRIASIMSAKTEEQHLEHAASLLKARRPRRFLAEQMENERAGIEPEELVSEDPKEAQTHFERKAEGLFANAGICAFLGAGLATVFGIEFSCVSAVTESALPDITGQAASIAKTIIPATWLVPAIAGERVIRQAGPRLKKHLKTGIAASVAIYVVSMSAALAAGTIADSLGGQDISEGLECISRGVSTAAFGTGIAFGMTASIPVASALLKKFKDAVGQLGNKLQAQWMSCQLKADLAAADECRRKKAATEYIVSEALDVLVPRTIAEISVFYGEVANVYAKWSDVAEHSGVGNLPFELRGKSASDLWVRAESLRLNNSVPALMKRLEHLPS